MNENPSPLEALQDEGAVDGRTWTTRQLRSLATLKDSAFWPALQAWLAMERGKHQAPLLDERTNFAQTQFHRGALRVIATLVADVVEVAPKLLEGREATKDDDA